jgi:4'-phosphopantetheinyl transferase
MKLHAMRSLPLQPESSLCPHLAPNEAHLWWARVEAMPAEVSAALRRLLSEEEQLRLDNISLETRRQEYLVTRALVRSVLSRYEAVEPAAWVFQSNPHGRPGVARPVTSIDYDFNVSHAHGIVLCLVARGRRVGVDVEHVDPNVDVLDVGAHFFTPSERADLVATAADLRCRRFFEYWTLKESYVKACGQGLAIALDSFGFSLQAGRQPRLRASGPSDASHVLWYFDSFSPGKEHVAAVTVERRYPDEPIEVAYHSVPGVPGHPWGNGESSPRDPYPHIANRS